MLSVFLWAFWALSICSVQDQILVVRLGGKALPGEPSQPASFKFFKVNKMVA